MKSTLLDKVFAFTEENALFSAPCHLLLGLSGGADSMALLHVLTHWPSSNIRVSAVHVHHGLRGKSADADEAFVRQHCEKHNVPLTIVRADVGEIAQREHLTIEQAGRRIRYEIFEAVRNEIGADCIVTAHTASDQVETVLLHLIRGCGVDGLRGIPAKRDCICRPLLCCSRPEIEDYCATCDIPYVVDETNYDVSYTRNDIRHRVLPLLREINPSVDTAMLRMSRCAAEDSAYINERVQAVLQSARIPDGYDVAVFAEQPSAVRRRLIRCLFIQAGVQTFEESHILAAEDMMLRHSGRVDLPDGFYIACEQGIVSLLRSKKAVLPSAVCVDSLPCSMNFGDMICHIFRVDDANVHNLFENSVVDYDKIQGALQLRCRQIGDYFHPAQRNIGKSLKKLMNEWHIPSKLRDVYPVLCDDAGVVLIPGYACDERVRVTEDTKHFLVCRIGTE